MRVVATLFAVEINGRVARIVVHGRLGLLLIPAISVCEAFQAGTGFDQSGVRGEMLVNRPAFLGRKIIDFYAELPGDFRRKGMFIVLVEDPVIETALVKFSVETPEPVQILAKLFAKEQFVAHTGLK